MSGNKTDILTRIYTYLHFSYYIIKIQRLFRGNLVRKYKDLHGPAVRDRKLCTNTNDFITMEPIEEVSFHQFLSYKDVDGFVYGFDIISLYNLFLKSKMKTASTNVTPEVLNPYNRNPIPQTVLKDIKTILKIAKILDMVIELQYEDDTIGLSVGKTIELRALTLFQNIDALGNYSDCQWFLSLNKRDLIKFTRELYEIWSYRSQINQETKYNICPLGDPFRYLSMSYIHAESNVSNIQKVILNVLENLVNTGLDKDSKTLGAYYVLGALTLVNESAATALPWLFQSFGYF